MRELTLSEARRTSDQKNFIICKVRPARPWTQVCNEDKSYQTFVDLQLKGKLKEFLQAI